MKRIVIIGFLAAVMSVLSMTSRTSFGSETPPAQAQTSVAQRLDDRISWDVKSGELMDLVFYPWPYKIRSLCINHNLPCGLEESPDDPIHQIAYASPDDRLAIKWASSTSTVRDFLDAILSTHPAYRWEVQDGVLVIVPKPGQEHRKWWKPVLGKKFKQYDADNNRAGNVLVEACYDAGIPIETIPLPQPGIPTILPRTMPVTNPITLHLKNVTVRQVLNAAVKADGKAIWKFSYDPKRKVYSIKVDSWGRTGELAIPW